MIYKVVSTVERYMYVIIEADSAEDAIQLAEDSDDWAPEFGGEERITNTEAWIGLTDGGEPAETEDEVDDWELE